MYNCSYQTVYARWDYIISKTKPHALYRWLFQVIFLLGYMWRVYLLNGWFIVTYGLGIYILNLFIGFLSPQVDPEDEYAEDEGLPSTLQQTSAEFRPFSRKVPEFIFWYGCIKAVFYAFVMTFFDVFNLPVFWPILLMYFIILFVVSNYPMFPSVLLSILLSIF